MQQHQRGLHVAGRQCGVTALFHHHHRDFTDEGFVFDDQHNGHSTLLALYRGIVATRGLPASGRSLKRTAAGLERLWREMVPRFA